MDRELQQPATLRVAVATRTKSADGEVDDGSDKGAPGIRISASSRACFPNQKNGMARDSVCAAQRVIRPILSQVDDLGNTPSRPLLPTNCSSAQLGVAAVAERLGFGMFAGAPGHGFLFENLDLLRRQSGALVRTVAKWLALRSTTSAPPIGARFDQLDNGR